MPPLARIRGFALRWGYYAKIISISLVSLTVLTFWGWQERGFVKPYGPTAYASILPHPVALLISVPLAYALLVYALQREKPFERMFSLPFFLVSLESFVGSMILDINAYWWLVLALAAAGVLSSFFAFVPWREFLKRAVQEWHLSLIALLAASMSYLYFCTDYFLFERLCKSTAMFVYWLLHGLGLEIGFTLEHLNKPSVVLYSQHYRLHVHRTCSGVEGIFLFQFLLSAMLITDWPLFRRQYYLLELYMLGFIYMFIVNCLRIASVFYLGTVIWQPDASPFAKSLRGAPLNIFHSVAGELYYFIAFAVFAAVLYRFGLRTGTSTPAAPELENKMTYNNKM